MSKQNALKADIVFFFSTVSILSDDRYISTSPFAIFAAILKLFSIFYGN